MMSLFRLAYCTVVSMPCHEWDSVTSSSNAEAATKEMKVYDAIQALP